MAELPLPLAGIKDAALRFALERIAQQFPIATQNILDNAITSAKILDNAITNAKMADNAIGNAEMADNAIGNAEMQDNAIGNAEMADDAVGEEETTTALNEKLGITEVSTARRGLTTISTSENTVSTTYADLATSGPSVTVTSASATSLLMIFARVSMRGNGGATASVDIQEDSVSMTGAAGIMTTSSAAFVTMLTAPFSFGAGVTEAGGQGSFLVMLPASAASHAYRLVYKRTGGTSADFQNRRLWVVSTRYA